MNVDRRPRPSVIHDVMNFGLGQIGRVDGVVLTRRGRAGRSLPGANSAGQYYAIDTTNRSVPSSSPAGPKSWPAETSMASPSARTAIAAISPRWEAFRSGNCWTTASPPINGLVVFDLSDIQSRKPNPQVKVVSTLYWKDGAMAQHTINVKIKGKPYLIFVDEAGSGGNGVAAQSGAAAMPAWRRSRWRGSST